MLFVHITHASAVPRIKKIGLIKHSGRFGKGIYCAPAMWIQGYIERKLKVSRQNWFTGKMEESTTITGDIFGWVSSDRLWRWLYRNYRHGKSKRTVLVLFRIHGEDVKGKLLLRHDGITLKHIESEKSLVDLLKNAGVSKKYCAQGDDDFEFILQGKVKPKQIIKFIPINRTNATFKKRRDRAGSFSNEY